MRSILRPHNENAGGKLLMPGNICSHTHFYGAFARGLYIPGPPPKDFTEILHRLWWTLDRALDDDGVLYSALVCLVDAIRNGTTTLVDHHASPAEIDGSLDIIAGAVEAAGLRAALCYEVTDRNGPAGARAGIDENVRFIKKTRAASIPAAGRDVWPARLAQPRRRDAGRLRGRGRGAGRRRLPRACGRRSGRSGGQPGEIRPAYGRPAGQRGILGKRTIVAHVTTIDAWEMAALRETGSWVTHQPRSNMNNAVGVADVPAMLRAGMPVLLGNDGFSNDMFVEMKTAYLLHKAWRNDPRAMPGDQVIGMAYGNNARLARQFFPQPLGEISPGAAADLILLDYQPTTPLTAANLPWHILFGVSGSHVTHTMVAGRWLMKNRELLTLDEAAITAQSRQVAAQTWERFWELSG